MTSEPTSGQPIAGEFLGAATDYTGRRAILRAGEALASFNRKVASLGVVVMLLTGILSLVDIIVFRWLLNSPIAGSNEIFGTVFAVAIAAVLASGLSQRATLEVDIMAGRLPARTVAAMRMVGSFLYLFCLVLLAVAVFEQAATAYRMGTLTAIQQWKLWPFYTGIFALVVLCVPSHALTALDLAAQWGKSLAGTVALFGGISLLATLVVLYGVSQPRPALASDPVLAATIAIFVLWVAILLFVPLAAAMIATAIVGIAATFGFSASLNIAGSETIGLLTSSELAIIPYFLLMGGFAVAGGMAGDIYRLAHAAFAPFRGGLALATIGGCAGFGALTGSSIATVISIGSAAYPEMKNRGYDPGLAAGSIAAGGTLGQLIPPSTVVVVYSVLVEQSIGAMYVAILVPAFLTVLMYSGTILALVRLNKRLAPAGQRWDLGELRVATVNCIPAIALFGVVLGGMAFGVVTATEAASLGAVFAFVVALWRGKLSKGAFWTIAAETTRSTSMIYFLIIGALVLTFFFGSSTITQSITKGILGLGLPNWGVILLLVVFYIIMGMFMDSMTIMMITASMAASIIQGLGYDLLWWGIVMVVLVEIGVLTPPFGMNLFVLKTVAPDIALSRVYKGVLPFVVSDAVKVALMLFFPALVTWLPNALR
ncbi:TRAP transporter large permease [Alsobacter sp. SYSU M60028]|uniref:TRAP transporter large permease n=1 Tax=Alsobacter ponti TaxID=2962936 RepID=A0ABT1LFW4_9HYPH|nr:TRAP transporter large permease subunit [Alsobacter ponti]MCP8939986.1 TRAP transporter large permease [Alsobacter ponti]